MSHKSIEKVAVVIPNLNGQEYIAEAVDSLLAQSFRADVIVVENASTDASLDILHSYGEKIILLVNKINLGFAGGVNTGIDYALNHEYDAIALFNNDAIANTEWLSHLVTTLEDYEDTGIVTGRIQLGDGHLLDSTGEFYTSWGLPYPRGREQPADTYTKDEYIFGASGGASLYRAALFRKIGMFDDTFFAYYEDTDISFRAQLAGWKIRYTPNAIVNHRQGATSKKMVRGFTVYQTFKNLPMLFTKNVPARLLLPIGIRFYFAYVLIFGKAIASGKGMPALKGILEAIILIPHTLRSRRTIQRTKTVSSSYISSIIVHDLPPDQTGIRKLRKFFLRK